MNQTLKKPILFWISGQMFISSAGLELYTRMSVNSAGPGHFPVLTSPLVTPEGIAACPCRACSSLHIPPSTPAPGSYTASGQHKKMINHKFNAIMYTQGASYLKLGFLSKTSVAADLPKNTAQPLAGPEVPSFGRPSPAFLCGHKRK